MAIPDFLKYSFVWILPLISAGMWLALLLAMLITWLVQGSPHLASMDSSQHIAYISDIGAFGLKPLFITGAVITTVFLDLSFFAERWLRHSGRLAKNLGKAEKVLSILSIICALAGTAGLILLSIFDNYHHQRLHDGLLLLFMAGYVLSAIFVCAEYQRLGVHFRQHRVLRASFWLKLFFILVELVLAVTFAGLMFGGNKNVAAVFEWIVALFFTFYVLTYFMDLLPASRSHQYHTNQVVLHELEMENGVAATNGNEPKPAGTAF